jgi:Ca2+-transporting ATPase
MGGRGVAILARKTGAGFADREPLFAAARERAAMLSPGDTLAAFASSWEGLSAEEASARLARGGENRLPTRAQSHLLKDFLKQFTHLFAFALWVAAGLAFVARMPELGWAVIAVVVVNGLFSFVQEYRAERAVLALSALLPETTQVRRGGQLEQVPATELVAGDVLGLAEGARVPADARVLKATGLRVDISALTGESEPVDRSAVTLSRASSDLEAENLLFAGAWVVAGSALAVVTGTGTATRLGQISLMAGKVKRGLTPLRVSVNRAVRTMGAVAVGAGALFATLALGLGMSARDTFLFGVGVIVALVPEGLLPTLTLSLAMGARRMAERGALVRDLEAVETLGSTSVICTDKTGTLTRNQMTVVRASTLDGELRVSGLGYAPRGVILEGDRPLSTNRRNELERLIRVAALCGDARIADDEGRFRCIGDPTEGALVVFAAKAGMVRERMERTAVRSTVFPFDSSRARMSTEYVLSTGERLLLTKGAVESVLPRCMAVQIGRAERPITAADRDHIEGSVASMAGDGLRVLALAERRGLSPTPARADEAEQQLTYLGLVGMWDPLRLEVPDAIGQCQRAGIRVMVLTGDHPATAQAIARHIGLQGEVRVGSELPTDLASLKRFLAGTVSVIARVAPEQKLAIARALQEDGHVVAMTGDGVNDAPALRQADIGVAMGASGTDVARGAADVVLLDDNFAHVVEAVEEGRAAFSNIRRFLTYHLTDNVAELAPFLLWAMSGGRFPLVLSVLQVLALDIGTDVLPALALGAEAPQPGVMREPPRSRGVRLLDRRVLARAFGFLGLIEAAASLALVPLGARWLLGHGSSAPLPRSGPDLMLLSTLVFSAIVVMQMANAFACRATPRSTFAGGPFSNHLLLGAVAFEFALLLAFVYGPPFNRLLGQVPLGPVAWLLIAVCPVLLLAAEELRKLVARSVVASGWSERVHHRALHGHHRP